MVLQLFLRLFCLFCLFFLVVFESHDDVRNQNYIRHKSCETTCVGCVACAKSVVEPHDQLQPKFALLQSKLKSVPTAPANITIMKFNMKCTGISPLSCMTLTADRSHRDDKSNHDRS